jgi:hypothetical protein
MKSVLGTDVKYAPLLKKLKVNLISDVKNKEGLAINICRIILKFSSYCFCGKAHLAKY